MIRIRELAKFVVLLMLRGYKWAVSPMFPPACRYIPTCSEYAMEAVERYGAVRGGFMAFTRLLGCHPFAHGGYDPVVKTANHTWQMGGNADAGLKPECLLVLDGAAGSRALSKRELKGGS